MKVFGLLSAALMLSSCAESDPGSLAEGIYVLRGEAILETGSEPSLRTEHLVLFVDTTGTPTHVRDERFDELFPLTFSGGLSDDVCVHPGCDLVVERSTRCAVWSYQDYFRPEGGSDFGHAYTGSVRACPTGEAFVHRLAVSGELDPGTVLPSGRLRITANYPLDPVEDAYQVLLDGEVIESTGADIELGPVPFGASFEFRYLGTRPVAPIAPTALTTSAVLTDISLASAPPEGAIDARGQPLLYEDESLVLYDEGHHPRVPFVVAVALGDPWKASELVLDVEVESREGGQPLAQLVSASGAGAEVVYLFSGVVPIPSEGGPLWLVISSDQDIPQPDDWADPEVFRIHSLSWQ